MDAETITALSNALSGPGSALLVILIILYGTYKVAVQLISPFLISVADSIKTGFQEQSSALTKLVDEIKLDREAVSIVGTKVDALEKDVSDIKSDVSDIKGFIRK